MPGVPVDRPSGMQAGVFSEYALDHCYDEMFDASGAPRPPEYSVLSEK